MSLTSKKNSTSSENKVSFPWSKLNRVNTFTDSFPRRRSELIRDKLPMVVGAQFLRLCLDNPKLWLYVRLNFPNQYHYRLQLLRLMQTGVSRRRSVEKNFYQPLEPSFFGSAQITPNSNRPSVWTSLKLNNTPIPLPHIIKNINKKKKKYSIHFPILFSFFEQKKGSVDRWNKQAIRLWGITKYCGPRYSIRAQKLPLRGMYQAVTPLGKMLGCGRTFKHCPPHPGKRVGGFVYFSSLLVDDSGDKLDWACHFCWWIHSKKWSPTIYRLGINQARQSYVSYEIMRLALILDSRNLALELVHQLTVCFVLIFTSVFGWRELGATRCSKLV